MKAPSRECTALPGRDDERVPTRTFSFSPVPAPCMTRAAPSRVSPFARHGFFAPATGAALAQALRGSPGAPALTERSIAMPNSRNPQQPPQQPPQQNVQDPGSNRDRQSPQNEDDRMTAEEEEEE